MRTPVIIALAGLTALALATGLVFVFGLDDQLARMVVSLQRDYQNALGRVLRALRAGEAGAVVSFLGICVAARQLLDGGGLTSGRKDFPSGSGGGRS